MDEKLEMVARAMAESEGHDWSEMHDDAVIARYDKGSLLSSTPTRQRYRALAAIAATAMVAPKIAYGSGTSREVVTNVAKAIEAITGQKPEIERLPDLPDEQKIGD